MASALLKACHAKTVPTFVLTLDLDEVNLVQPIMSTMVSNIIEYCTCLDAETTTSPTTTGTVTEGTTNLSKLQSTTFGKAPIEAAENTIVQENKMRESSCSIRLNIIICGIFTTQKSKVTYKDKQAVNLISYHLQKYASDLNCTLCFVKDEGEEDKENDEEGTGGGGGEVSSSSSDALRPKGMSVQEFGRALKRVCIPMIFNEEADNGSTDDPSTGEEDEGNGVVDDQHQPSIYGPYQYDVDLINSVLLRGAGCPGVWNANTDSLWVALPPPPNDEKSESKADDAVDNSKATLAGHGDEEWLTKLADSVSAYVGSSSGSDGKSIRSTMDHTVRTTRTSANNTVVTKQKVVKKKPTASGEKKDSQDVQDFFAGLLNK